MDISWPTIIPVAELISVGKLTNAAFSQSLWNEPIAGCANAASSEEPYLKLIITSLVAPLVTGLIAAAAALWFNKQLETHKGKIAFQTAIAEERLKAYLALWAKTQGYTSDDLKDLTKGKMLFKLQEKASELREWYYESSGALHLSHPGVRRFFSVKEALNIATEHLALHLDDKQLEKEQLDIVKHVIHENFSALRTQLKVDMELYTKKEATMETKKQGLTSFDNKKNLDLEKALKPGGYETKPLERMLPGVARWARRICGD